MNRRRALKTVSGAGAALPANAADGPLRVAGQDVEIHLSSVSPFTFRLTVFPVRDGKPAPVVLDGLLVRPTWGTPVARLRGEVSR
jgi:hypothetical protein